MKEYPTPRFPQERLIQCFCEVMERQLLVEDNFADNAIFQRWMKDCPTPGFLQDCTIQCYSEVMAELLLVGEWLGTMHDSLVGVN